MCWWNEHFRQRCCFIEIHWMVLSSSRFHHKIIAGFNLSTTIVTATQFHAMHKDNRAVCCLCPLIVSCNCWNRTVVECQIKFYGAPAISPLKAPLCVSLLKHRRMEIRLAYWTDAVNNHHPQCYVIKVLDGIGKGARGCLCGMLEHSRHFIVNSDVSRLAIGTQHSVRCCFRYYSFIDVNNSVRFESSASLYASFFCLIVCYNLKPQKCEYHFLYLDSAVRIRCGFVKQRNRFGFMKPSHQNPN